MGVYSKDSQYFINLGEVVSVEDDVDGLRIKCRIAGDDAGSYSNLPYCIPLLPKVFQSVPKLGECALVLCSEVSNKSGVRYYIGPLISQPQRFYKDRYDSDMGSATSILPTGEGQPLETITHFKETDGSFPNKNDVAVIGRKGEDIILKDDEINIRCGIRTSAEAMQDDNLKGHVLYNSKDPAYIQLQRGTSSLGSSTKELLESKSVINLVADKINIVSNKDNNIEQEKIHQNNKVGKDVGSIWPQNQMEDVLTKLHQLPYGDTLIEVLKIMMQAIENHVHRFPLEKPDNCDYIKALRTEEAILEDKILSKHVRIS